MDEAIIRLRILHPGTIELKSGSAFDGVAIATDFLKEDWANYVYRYLNAHAMQETSLRSTLGRFRRAAQTICELDGGAADEDAVRR
ncbi:hypothetical protein PG994_006896 [Apiospora phragmitis]|uniref:Uncharacterized protein n=1 Tax=Apiospora phragmitis TaxID=2905665 RepID=A0ABR1VJ84_9PEZI